MFGGNYPRAAIVAYKCNLLLCSSYSSRDMTTCQTLLDDGKEVYIVSVYCDITQQSLPAELDKLLLEKPDANIIIGMDANSHSPMWGCNETNKRGEMMEDFIMDHNLQVCNRGNKATFVARGAETIIDVTLCTSNSVNRVINWEVKDPLHFTDHRRVVFYLVMERQQTKKGWNLKDTDWEKFRHLMGPKDKNLRSHRFWTPDTVDYELKLFYSDVNDALSKVCKKVRAGRSATNPWWNEELTDLRREARKWEKKAMKHKGDELIWATYRRARNDFTMATRKAKRLAWKSFTEEATSLETMSRLTKVIFRKEGKKLGHLKKGDGTFTQNREEILDTLMDSFLPDSKAESEGSIPASVFITEAKFRGIFSIRRLKEAFSSFKKKKSPGPDGIRPEVLQNLGDGALRRLGLIFSASLALGYVPNGWRTAEAVLIPKVGKKDYTDPRAFRPISLTSFLFKGMERVIGWHLEEIGITDKLSRNQHAFRKARSTDTILSEVVDLIEQSVLRKSYALGVFFDIEGAFDNVLPCKVIEGLKEKGVPKDITSWYGFYLTNRSVKITLGRTVRQRFLTRGTPQGGILSPLAWNVVFDSLLQRLKEFSGVQPRGYADDGMFLISGICPNTIVDLAQPAINAAVGWGTENGLKFSSKKTQVVLFTRRKKAGDIKSLKINGLEIPFSDRVTYLGITLNRRLTWEDHITTKINKAKAKLSQLRTATGVRWGPSPKMMLWAYNSIIMPALTYGAMIWGHKTPSTKAKKDLGRLNRLASTGISSIKKSTPTAGLEVILDLKPVDLVIEEAGLSAYWRWKPKLKWTGRGEADSQVGHVLSWTKRGAALKVEKSTVNRKTFRFNWDPPCFLASRQEAENFTTTCEIHTWREEDRTLLTFDIKENNRVNRKSGSLIIRGPEGNSLYKGLDMTLQALYRDLEGRGVQKVMVISRHRPAPLLQPIIKDLRTKTLLETVEGIRERTGHKVAFAIRKKVQRERDPPSENTALWPVHGAMVDPEVIRKLINERGYNIWQKRWITAPAYVQTKLWFPKVKREVTPFFKCLPRNELGMAIQLLTGHNNLGRHQAKVQALEQVVDCRLCGEEEEDAVHLWERCPVMAVLGWSAATGQGGKRVVIMGERTVVWTPAQLISFLKMPPIVELMQPSGEER